MWSNYFTRRMTKFDMFICCFYVILNFPLIRASGVQSSHSATITSRDGSTISETFDVKYSPKNEKYINTDRLFRKIFPDTKFTYHSRKSKLIVSHEQLDFSLSRWLWVKTVISFLRNDATLKSKSSTVVFAGSNRLPWWLKLFKMRQLELVTTMSICDGYLKVAIKLSRKGLSRKDNDSTLRIFKEYVQSALSEELELIDARVSQQQDYSAKSKVQADLRRARNIDRVINPDKYKKKSSTVRSPSSAGASRYTPNSRMREKQRTRGGWR